MRINKACCIFLCMLLVFVTSSSVFAFTTTNQQSTRDQMLQTATKLVENIPTEGFGGQYFDESGHLVINVKKEFSETVNTQLQKKVSEHVKVRIVKYSLAELEEMKKAIIPYMTEYGIATLDANEVTQTIDIELYADNLQLYELIKSLSIVDPEIVNVVVLDSDIRFSNAVSYEPPDYNSAEAIINTMPTNRSTLPPLTIYPGMVLHNLTENGYFTAGPNSGYGTFYSAGHCTENGDYIGVYPAIPTTPPYSNHIGRVVGHCFSSSGDFCEIAVENLGALPNGLKFDNGNTYMLGYTCYTGDGVELLGGFSGLVSGSVSGTNVAKEFDGLIIDGLIKTTIQCRRGDSGGGLYSRYSYNNGSGKCYGVLTGGDFYVNSETSFNAYFSPFW